MGVKCQILINRTKEGHFRAGQYVTGTLKYFIKKPTRYNSIDISFVGKGRCHWSETYNDDSTEYSNDEEYVSIHKNLYKPVGDQKLGSGDYEYPFEFLLPDDIPSSVKNPFCNIQYKIFVKFARKKPFSSGDEFDTEVPVYGHVKPCGQEPLIFGVEKKLLSFNLKNKVKVKAEIDRTCLNPGETINLMMMVNNDSNVPVSITSELVQCFTYVSKGRVGTKKIVRSTVKGTEEHSPTLKNKSVMELVSTIPTLETMYSIHNTKIMIGEYKVKMTVNVPFPHVNAEVEVPVVIGWRKEE